MEENTTNLKWTSINIISIASVDRHKDTNMFMCELSYGANNLKKLERHIFEIKTYSVLNDN